MTGREKKDTSYYLDNNILELRGRFTISELNNSLYEIENPVDQLADILSLAEDTEGIKDLITLGNGEDFKALNQMVDDQYWEKVQLEDLLKDLSSEELKLLENKIEDIKI